ncbi:MAG TPA: hypothetical protein VN420_02835 [Candidatus Fimivivens sp.]|nr:hypothetical protein [Candidatus Fimivivens sp.]
MLDKTITDNHLGNDGRLYLKAFRKIPAVPAGTHDYLASGRDGERHILITAYYEMPYLFSMDETDFRKLGINTFSGGCLSFVVKNENGYTVTIRMQDELDPDTDNEAIDTTSMRLQALERNGYRGYTAHEHRTQVVALCSTGQDPFIVLGDGDGSGNYRILFVPKSFASTTEWVLAEAKPWEYELKLSSAKCLRIPYFCAKVS